ncbi:hypothetical protein B0H14DRAFT_3176125 [Mycena olivaceomarginata]|nr:hypothetical protein B0H14DRAFT_3176125 [Mycena olivaceomarginata]
MPWTPASSAAAAPGGRTPRGRLPARCTTTTTRPAPVPPGPAKWPPAVTTRAPTAGENAARAAAQDVATPAPAAAAARTTRVGTGTRPRAATTRAPVAPSAFRMGAGALRTGPGLSTPVAGAGGGGRTSVAATTRAPSVLRTSRPPTAVGGRRVVAAGIDPIDVELGADAGEGPTGEEEEFLFDV